MSTTPIIDMSDAQITRLLLRLDAHDRMTPKQEAFARALRFEQESRADSRAHPVVSATATPTDPAPLAWMSAQALLDASDDIARLDEPSAGQLDHWRALQAELDRRARAAIILLKLRTAMQSRAPTAPSPAVVEYRERLSSWVKKARSLVTPKNQRRY
jgi:hypothetical protein